MRRSILALLVFLAAAALVEAATLRGAVRDSVTGKPVAQARVELLEAAGTRVVTTDDSGSFAIEILAAGPVTLAVSHPGYQVTRLALSTLAKEPLAVALDPIISVADRIEVTATRAREGTDPITVTNISQDQIRSAYWAQDPAILLSSLAPSFFSYNDSGNDIGYSYFWVRGFSQSLTRVTLNGAPLNDAESGELFFIDLADFLSTTGDIQVQRGVFGLSGIGGAVDITTAPPAMQSAFTLQTGFGSYGTSRFTARYDSGLINGTWALTARYSKVRTDGYRDQSWVDMWNYFLSLTRFGEDSRLRLVMFGGPEQTHLAYDGIPKYVLDGGLTGNADKDRRFNPLTYPNELDNFYQPHFQLIHDLAISPSTQLSQTFFYFSGKGYYDQYKRDRKLYEYYLPDVVLPDGTVITRTDLVRRRTVDEGDAGWVPTLTHTEGDWTFTLKGEVSLHDAHHYGQVTWAQHYPPDVPPDHSYYDYRVSKQVAALAFGAAWSVNPALTVSGGLEYAYRRYRLYDDQLTGLNFTQPYDFLLPRLGAIVHVAPDTDLYANVARGMREPNLRDIYDPQDYYSTYANLAPEDVWDWEAGISVRRARWRARANAFWMNFSNEIVYAGALDENGVPIYGNGAQSVHRGVELDASWDPSPVFGLDAMLTYSRNTFTHYQQYNWDGTVSVFDGNYLAGYPNVLGVLTARTNLGPVQLALTGKRVGQFYLDNTQDNKDNPEARQQPGYVPLVNPAFTLVNLSAQASLPAFLPKAIGLSQIGLELRVNNLLNQKYTAFGYVDVVPLFIPAATRNVYVGLTLGL